MIQIEQIAGELPALKNMYSEAEESLDPEKLKKSLAELESRKVTLYGNVEVRENSGIHYYEKVRNTVIRSTSPVRQRWAPPII